MIVLGVMTILMAGFLLIIGLMILDNLYIQTSDISGIAINETHTTVDETGEVLTNTSYCGSHSFAIIAVTNATNATMEEVVAANYTVDARLGIVSFIGAIDQDYNETDWNVSYTFLHGNDRVCPGTNETMAGLANFSEYIDLIVLAVIISVVISLILGIAAFRTIR